MQQAVEIEGATPKPAVTPAATLPASELMGDLMIELARSQEAAAAYRQSLQRFPRRFNGTLGVARALAQAGDAAGAAEQYRELLRIAEHGTRPVLREAHDFIAAYTAVSVTDKTPSYALESEYSHR
jgi:predicted negative regulator of RcsB-dependent stress response